MLFSTIRLFGQNLYLPLIALGIFEGGLFSLGVAAALAAEPRSIVPVEWSAVVVGTATVLAMTAFGLYRVGLRESVSGIALRLALSIGLVVGSVIILAQVLDVSGDTQLAIVAVGVVGFVLSLLAHLFYFRLSDEDAFKRRIFVLGTGATATSIKTLRRRADRRGFTIVGFVGDPDEKSSTEISSISTSTDLVPMANRHEIDEVVVALDDRRNRLPLHQLMDLRLSGVRVIDIASFFEREAGKVRIDLVRPSWFVFSEGFRYGPTRRLIKRVFDLVAALLLLAFTWPVMAVAALAIKLEDGAGSDVFYRQYRTGEGGRVFRLIKFRSMRPDAEKDGQAKWAERNDPRVTAVGAFMRKTRIDELPQLFNVLLGDMSFVGPRPERPEFVAELEKSIPFYGERHRIKPGITGWAQLNYPYGSSRDDTLEKLQYDLYYLKNQGLMLDLMILLYTVETVLFGKGAR